MTTTVNIHEAKTHLSRLVERAARGEVLIIAKAGRPVAKLVPLTANEPKSAKRLGFLEGAFKVPEDFDRMGSIEIVELFGEA